MMNVFITIPANNKLFRKSQNESFNLGTKKKIILPIDIPRDNINQKFDNSEGRICQNTKETIVISTENKFNNNISVTSL